MTVGEQYAGPLGTFVTNIRVSCYLRFRVTAKILPVLREAKAAKYGSGLH